MNNIVNVTTHENRKLPNRIFVYAEPRTVNSLRELFVARYPNGKVEPSIIKN